MIFFVYENINLLSLSLSPSDALCLSNTFKQIHSILKTQSKTRLVGANCPGIISAIGKCRIGFQPLPCFAPGNVGIVAKSGTLSYETVASTTRAGLGQSLCISMGGDVLAGTNFVDGLRIFEDDPDTEGIILVGEIGGTAELDAAEWIRGYRARVRDPKYVVLFSSLVVSSIFGVGGFDEMVC
jgi:succinyl-CoA synthetase alpha subunit